MSAPAFTPGPWRTEPKGHGMFDILAGPDYFSRTYVAFTGSGDDIPSEANARLIAAAPSMYADAEFLCARVRELESDLADDVTARHYYGHVIPALARMESCLAEARGESL